jgi:hypothetical protein
MPLPHQCRIPFVRAPGQDLRLMTLTSDLLAMPVTRVKEPAFAGSFTLGFAVSRLRRSEGIVGAASVVSLK